MTASSAAARTLRLADTAVSNHSSIATTLLEEAVTLCKAAGCSASLQNARALRQLSDQRGMGGDSTQSLRLADEANAVLVALGENDVAVQTELARCDRSRGNALCKLGRDGESLLAHQACLQRCELLGNEYGSISALANVGELLMQAGKYDDALHHLRLAEARAQASPVEFARELAELTGSLGDAFACLGRYAEAADRMRRCKTRSLSVFGRRSPQSIISCSRLAAALTALEDYTGAAQQLCEAESICEQRGWMDTEGGDVHFQLGTLATAQGRHQDALERFQRSLALQRRFYPAEHQLIVSSLRCIGEAQ